MNGQTIVVGQARESDTAKPITPVLRSSLKDHVSMVTWYRFGPSSNEWIGEVENDASDIDFELGTPDDVLSALWKWLIPPAE